MIGCTRRSFTAGGAAILAGAATRGIAAGPSALQTSFKPGERWLDVAGKPIQAHGGSVIVVGGRFYWYGDNKEFTTGKTKVWTWGVRCYVSDDLYNWEDLGLIVSPDTKDRTSPLHPEQAKLDRPHILYNKATKKFVCWVKIMAGGTQTRTMLVADRITGPYTIVAKNIRPLGMNAGDFDLVASPDDGKAYTYFERVHSELICADLTDDYTGLTGFYSTHFPRPSAPSVREGPAYFRRGGKHYLATSSLSGYYPNPSEIAVADTFHGPFRLLGDLHPSDRSRSSFNLQISCIFKHPKKRDLYIAMADRWQGTLSGADFESGERWRAIESALTKATLQSQPRMPMTDKEKAAMPYVVREPATADARYVWLPLRFRW